MARSVPLMGSPPRRAASSLTDFLLQRAAETPDRVAVRFLRDGAADEDELTYGEWRRGAMGVASCLKERGLKGQPILITAAPGRGFVASLFGAWLAGCIAVPAYPPRGRRHRARLEAIRDDCGARVCLGEASPRQPDGLISLDPADLAGADAGYSPTIDQGQPCLLQYTSGSTASPKGVVLRHDTLGGHLDRLHELLAPGGFESILSWLPPYHDMGLVLKILYSLRSGTPLTWMSPDHFVQRPLRWLRAIDRYRANMSGGPNFAYEWCLRAAGDEDLATLDLSCWTFAPCGAERVRRETLERFSKRFEPCGFDPGALYPGYGLAEATLVVTSPRVPGPESWRVSRKDPTQVSCGPPLDGTRVRIVDAATRRELPEGVTGEIEVASASVADGYWQRPEATAEVFRDGWRRTGDLGFLEDGQLFVVGRIKDLIIVDGVNVAPEDIESLASAVDDRLTGVAAFAIDSDQGEGIALAVEARDVPVAEQAVWCARLRSELASRAGHPIRRVLLVRPGLLPRTTSGKVQRHAVREAFEQDRLAIRFDDAATKEPANPSAETPALDALLDAVHRATGREGARASDDLASFGVSSIDVTRIIALVRQSTGVELQHADLFNASDFEALARTIARRQPSEADERIVPGSGRGSGLVSHSQERMAFLHRLDPDSAAYHVFGCLELRGPLDRGALVKACRRLAEAHPILRTRHAERDGVPVTGFDGAIPSIEEREGEPHAELADFARRPFDLASESPIRLRLVPVARERHVLGLCAHHIVADGWSARILVRDLAANYDAYRRCVDPPALPDGPDFIDYAAWQRKRIDEGAADDQVAFWKNHLAGHPGKIEMVTDFTRPPKSSSDGGAVTIDLPAALEAAVERLARQCGATPFMVRFAAWLLLLRAHGGGDDLVSAVPVANRHHAVAGDLVGTLVNTLPLRVTLDPGDRFLDLVERVREACFGMQANQEAPFEKIIEAVKPDRARDRAPIAQVMFDHQELPLPESWGGGLTCRPLLVHRGAVQFDLSLVSFRLPDRTQLILEFRRDLFREESIRAMLGRYLALLTAACEAPETATCRFDALSADDLRRLETFAQGPSRPDFPCQTAPSLIARSIDRHPGRHAFVTPGGGLTYRQLGDRSDALAACLRGRGVVRGDRVALMLDRSLDLPCAMLAIWKCGAAYLPLDPDNPKGRLSLILEDQQPIRVLVSPGYRDRLPEGTEMIELGGELFDHPAGENTAPAPDDPAYILYTSGSTGKPKGVVIPHGALANFLLSMAEAPGFRAGETLLAVTTISFDISGLELFLPLVQGGTVDLVSSRTARDADALRRRIETSDPDVMQATPATWRMLIDAGWGGSPRLRILCGGEALDPPLARKLRPLGAELWNLYGPTETTIWSTIQQVPEDPGIITIGRPIANTSIRILSAGNRPTPPGVPGELLIGGAGLATGYWKRDRLTADRFVEIDGGRFYRTGDLARWLPNGEIECLGRTDSQVKVRGFRVELGEFDAAILSHAFLDEAATLLVCARLLRWFRSASALDPRVLGDHLKGCLPAYMLPARLVPLGEFPLTTSGKIDRKALAARPLPETDRRDAAAPNDPLVHDLTSLWAEVLGLPGVAPDDDFFDLGGHSLLAARLVSAAGRRTGLRIPLDWLFDRPTPAGMAARLRADAADDLARPRAIPLSRGNGGTPLFWVHTLVDGGMGLLPYRETAAMLSDIADSYGIAEGTETFDSLTELAAAHVESIRAVQPDGPYRLAGFCFGGNVAAEIACQLVEAGEAVELLALLESSPPNSGSRRGWWRSLSTWSRIFRRLPERIRSLAGRDVGSMVRRLKMKHRAATSTVDQLVNRDRSIPDLHGVLDLEVLDANSRRRAVRHWTALHRHQARLPGAGRIVLVRAFDEGWLPREPNLGWKPAGPIEIYTVSGRHEDFLRNHSAREVATILRGLF